MSRPRAALVALATAVAVPVTLALPSGPAAAELPTRYTTYRDSSIETSDHSGKITIKVGSDPHRIAKIVIVADCGGDKERYTRRDLAIRDDGRFRFAGGGYLSIAGRFRTKHWVTGSVTTNQCGFFGGDFSARDQARSKWAQDVIRREPFPSVAADDVTNTRDTSPHV